MRYEYSCGHHQSFKTRMLQLNQVIWCFLCHHEVRVRSVETEFLYEQVSSREV